MNNRQCAFEILNKVFKENKYSNILLNKVRNQEDVLKIDLSFITKLTYGTIQYKIYLEYVLNKLINPDTTDYKIQIIIWMAMYEFLYLDKPNYVIVNEYVELSKKINHNLTGLVNKVLKTITIDKNIFNVDIKNKKNIQSLKNGIPFFIYQKIAKDYGNDVAEKIIKNINVKKMYSYRINTLKTTAKSFYENLNIDFDFIPSKIAQNCFKTNFPLVNSQIFNEGLIYAQDECSVLVSQILNPSLNSKVLDMCCAPGGKLTHLSAIMQNTGIIYGNDISESKNYLIKENIVRMNCQNIELINNDATMINDSDFDFILLDAPCSGIGVMKTKPEIRLKNPKEIFSDQLLETQKKLLEKAADLLKIGGELVYSTCTINKDENINQIEFFLKNHSNFKIIEKHQFFGYEYNTDGFFICKLRKNN